MIVQGQDINASKEIFVIAEIGNNHQGDLEICKQMIKAAKDAGASAVKLQKRDNKALFTKSFYDQPYESPNAFAETYGKHREALELSDDDFVQAFKYAKELDIIFFASPWDVRSADFLHELGVKLFKIASADITNTPLLRHVAKFNLPMIISTGGATIERVQEAVREVRQYNENIGLLQCTAAYPALDEQLNVSVVQTYKSLFPELTIGYSGHDVGTLVPIVAVAQGAKIIEKHFTLDHTLKGTDHAVSLEPQELAQMITDLKRTVAVLGDGKKTVYEEEKRALKKLGKKLVASHDLPKGHVIREEDMAVKSPGDGEPPCKIDDFVGKSLIEELAADQDVVSSNLR